MNFLTISDYQAPFILYRDDEARVVHVTDSNHRTICTFGEYTQINLNDDESLASEYDSHIELALFIAGSMNEKLGIEMPLSLKDCFDSEGELKYDPYRANTANPVHVAYEAILFDDYGDFLRDPEAIIKLAKDKKWPLTCDAIGLYHANIHGSKTKGSYPPRYYFR